MTLVDRQEACFVGLYYDTTFAQLLFLLRSIDLASGSSD